MLWVPCRPSIPATVALLWGASACGGTQGLGPDGRRAIDRLDAAQATAPDAADAIEAAPGATATPMNDPSGGCNGDGIVPDNTGFVAPGTNASGIAGGWSLHSDCDDFSALEAGAPRPGIDCSRVSAPLPGAPFAPQPGTAQMCTAGSTVIVESSDQWATRWGAYIALDLNAVGGAPRSFDANAAGVRGFCFYVTGNTLPIFRVRFPSDQGFAGRDWYQMTLQHEGWHSVLFADLRQVAPSGTAFDPSKLLSIEFEIPASKAEAVAWDFCVDGLVALR